jgi:hypothetical protein
MKATLVLKNSAGCELDRLELGDPAELGAFAEKWLETVSPGDVLECVNVEDDMGMKETAHINRQLGDYVICSNEPNVAPFYVRMAGATEAISNHPNVTDAVKAIQRYQAGDRRRARGRA